jgi:hypothetical protein
MSLPSSFLLSPPFYDHAYDAEDLNDDVETLSQLKAKGLIRA